MRFGQKQLSTIAISFLLLSGLLSCAGPSENPVASSHSHEGHHEDTHSDGHSHDHDDSSKMMTMSPDQADALIEIEFRNGEVITSSNRVSISIGDQIVFSVVSDTDEFIHVHGINFMGEVFANSSVNYFGFTMEAPGIFEVEFENSGTFIAELLAS